MYDVLERSLFSTEGRGVGCDEMWMGGRVGGSVMTQCLTLELLRIVGCAESADFLGMWCICTAHPARALLGIEKPLRL
jgi:hypothetical protein